MDIRIKWQVRYEKMLKPNIFITFEGIDGAGKGTQLTKLFDLIINDENGFLGNKYSTVWRSREPTKLTESGTYIAKKIRSEEGATLEEAAEFFIKDRIEHTQEFILPSLARGDFVLVDRYDISTLSYQITQAAVENKSMTLDELYHKHNYGSEGTIIPNLTLVFDVPAQEGMRRMGNRAGIKEQYEQLSFQEELVKNQEKVLQYLSEKQPTRQIIRINANQSPGAVTEEMIDKINGSKYMTEAMLSANFPVDWKKELKGNYRLFRNQ